MMLKMAAALNINSSLVSPPKGEESRAASDFSAAQPNSDHEPRTHRSMGWGDAASGDDLGATRPLARGNSNSSLAGGNSMVGANSLVGVNSLAGESSLAGGNSLAAAAVQLLMTPPAQLELRPHGGVWTRTSVGRGVRFGPFLGRWVLEPLNDKYAWEVSTRFIYFYYNQ